jgi:dienelactone hydrolase
MTTTQDQGRRREELYALLGELPDRHRPIVAQRVGQIETVHYVLERLALDLNGIELVPAYFARPRPQSPALDKGRDAQSPPLNKGGARGVAGETARLPTVLYNHSHGGEYEIGKEELLAGRHYMHQPAYAEVLTEMGYNVLCIDAWAFGERRGRGESAIFKEMLWRGRVMWGMMVYDSLRAVDYLMMRADVDPSRVATLGMSMGSTMAWWLAALDERIKVCVDICCLTEYEALIETQGLDRHGVYYYVPGLLKHFSSAEINALIAPRPHLSLAGELDPLTPPAGLDRIDRHLREVYAAQGAPDAWRLVRSQSAHLETAAMRSEVLAFLGSNL